MALFDQFPFTNHIELGLFLRRKTGPNNPNNPNNPASSNSQLAISSPCRCHQRPQTPASLADCALELTLIADREKQEAADTMRKIVKKHRQLVRLVAGWSATLSLEKNLTLLEIHNRSIADKPSKTAAKVTDLQRYTQRLVDIAQRATADVREHLHRCLQLVPLAQDSNPEPCSSNVGTE